MFFISHKWYVLSVSVITLSIATNAVTTMMIAYKLWYVALMDPAELTKKGYSREHRTIILKTLGPSRRKSPVQTILILLVESGLVYLAIQVSYFG